MMLANRPRCKDKRFAGLPTSSNLARPGSNIHQRHRCWYDSARAYTMPFPVNVVTEAGVSCDDCRLRADVLRYRAFRTVTSRGICQNLGVHELRLATLYVRANDATNSMFRPRPPAYRRRHGTFKSAAPAWKPQSDGQRAGADMARGRFATAGRFFWNMRSGSLTSYDLFANRQSFYLTEDLRYRNQ